MRRLRTLTASSHRNRPLATEDELIQFCRSGLPTFKRPRRAVFTHAYPTTATGKIRQVELRQMATALLAENQPAARASV